MPSSLAAAIAASCLLLKCIFNGVIMSHCPSMSINLTTSRSMECDHVFRRFRCTAYAVDTRTIIPRCLTIAAEKTSS
ncbi:uncharacterized protein F5891DRAFT_1060469 [Suillus fuscotomentosus]|uniref:Secreted protein n=1 Tax=Suillus fuscotomentosus TaxID=1912939 RepID=A0AAD4HER7_9AGAM|nr:uncharacterized protein F5891DRAFT_1060469 [Suillus fuscotomentosus]KAG1894930.1 hypothetical protein F5891DRAFT_1060469 [Suillus fuscotomentosus]